MTTALRHPSLDCPICQNHLACRWRALVLEVCRLALGRGIDPVDLLRRHMAAIHDRHRAGLSLAQDAA